MMGPFSQYIGDREFWAKTRWDYLRAARNSRLALTNPDGIYALSPDDQRVKQAVNHWVQKARNAHAFALGRKQVIENCLVIDGVRATAGELYATRLV